MDTTDLQTTRMRKWGRSWVCAIPRVIREKMGLAPGDFILMRVNHDGVLIARKASPSMIYNNVGGQAKNATPRPADT